jgi:hypothetical protein
MSAPLKSEKTARSPTFSMSSAAPCADMFQLPGMRGVAAQQATSEGAIRGAGGRAAGNPGLYGSWSQDSWLCVPAVRRQILRGKPPATVAAACPTQCQDRAELSMPGCPPFSVVLQVHHRRMQGRMW